MTVDYKTGFYQVGNEIHLSKLTAILASQKTGHFPYWNFHDNEFAKHNWSQEPSESLWELYRQRAQQLREKYDWLVVLYSGGADSSNVLQSFLFNNILIDEVLCYGPFKTTQGHDSKLTTDPVNNYREIDLIALPYLRELAKHHQFKVTLYDWTDDVANGFDSADWIWTEASHRFSPSMAGRNQIHSASRSALDRADLGQKVGFIIGMDKPRIQLSDSTYQCAFLDLFMTMSVGPKDLLQGNTWITDELFYWSADLPKLVIKQAHAVMNFFQKNPSLKHYVTGSKLGGWQYRKEYYEICKALLYPYWNRDAFQTDKINSVTLSENDSWYLDELNLDSRRNWIAGLDEIDRVIDKKWLHNGTIQQGLVGTWSKFYTIGKE